MRSFLLKTAAVAAFIGLASAALALTGTPPGTGPQLIDGTWLNGLAGGQNNLYVSGLTATGTNQSTASAIPSGAYLVEVDTVPSGTGVYLPFAINGTDMLVYNNGANTLTVYPNINNDTALSPAAQDTINNTTSVTITSHSSQSFSVAKTGNWFGK